LTSLSKMPIRRMGIAVKKLKPEYTRDSNSDCGNGSDGGWVDERAGGQAGGNALELRCEQKPVIEKNPKVKTVDEHICLSYPAHP